MKISNETYERALKNNDNIMIMYSVTSKFLNILDKDEIKRCKLIGLWKALQKWKSDGGRKFTTFLYQRVYWECLKIIIQKKQNKYIPTEYIDSSVLPKPSISELVEDLPKDLQDIVIKRYIYGMTLREIGKEHNCCYETIRCRLKNVTIDSKY